MTLAIRRVEVLRGHGPEMHRMEISLPCEPWAKPWAPPACESQPTKPRQYKLAHKSKNPVTHARRSEVCRLRNQGLTKPQIAARMKVDRSLVTSDFCAMVPDKGDMQ